MEEARRLGRVLIVGQAHRLPDYLVRQPERSPYNLADFQLFRISAFQLFAFISAEYCVSSHISFRMPLSIAIVN